MVQVSQKDYKRWPDELFLANGRRLDVIVKGRLPLCHRCRSQGHFRENCPRVERSRVMEELEKENAGAVSVSGSTMDVKPLKSLHEDVSLQH